MMMMMMMMMMEAMTMNKKTSNWMKKNLNSKLIYCIVPSTF